MVYITSRQDDDTYMSPPVSRRTAWGSADYMLRSTTLMGEKPKTNSITAVSWTLVVLVLDTYNI